MQLNKAPEAIDVSTVLKKFRRYRFRDIVTCPTLAHGTEPSTSPVSTAEMGTINVPQALIYVFTPEVTNKRLQTEADST